MKYPDKFLKDALIKTRFITEEDIDLYSSDVQVLNISLKDFLLQKGLIDERQILKAFSQCFKLEIFDMKNAVIGQEVIDRIPIKFAWYYKFMPVRLENDVLVVAVSYPIDVKTQDEIKMHLGIEVKIVLALEKDLLEAIKKHYGLASDTIDRIMSREPATKEPSAQASDSGQWIEDLEKVSDDPTVSNLVNEIILEAYKKRATDIHIEPYRNKVRIRYRVDGVLLDANVSKDVRHFIPQILSRIKILANLSITERRLPQDGSAVVKTNEQQLDLRVSTMPTPRGESMVIRILPTKVMMFSLEKLGFNASTVGVFRELVQRPHGIIFITGPTGSGKTTSLYACLNEINSSNRKIITIEDPVEYEVEGITQVQVNTKVDFSFARGLRSILRHDPDILMVGEVRDPETAEIAIKTALTGHLVFSTLHTNDASSGITRLIDMGIEPYLVASSVISFVAQRLVRVICPQCKEIDPDPIPGIHDEIRRSLHLDNSNEIKIYKGKGCEFCNSTGFYGRVAIYEILLLNDAVRSAILEKQRADHIKKIAVLNGMMTLRQNGWKTVLEGVTTPQEIMNLTVKDEDYERSVQENAKSGLGAKDLTSQSPEAETVKITKKNLWAEKNEFDSRIYPRSFEPVEIRYRLLRRDHNTSEMMILEGVEHPSVTEDISAGGVSFISKVLLSVGTIIELKIQLGQGQKSIECLSKVCRVEEDSLENVYKIVTYFLDISSADRSYINKYIESKLNAEQKLVFHKPIA